MTTITYTAQALDLASCDCKPHPTRMPVLVDDSSIKTYTSQGWIIVGQASITVDYITPQEMDDQRLNALKAELDTTLARHQMEKNDIMDRLSKLTAIGYTEAA